MKTLGFGRCGKDIYSHDSTKLSREFFAPCRQEFIHTSHASPDLLKDFAKAVHPNMLIPVHGEGWDTWGGAFFLIYGQSQTVSG